MEQFNENLYSVVATHLPTLAAALAFLIVGWIIALAISAGVRKLLEKTTLDNKLAEELGLGKNREDFNVESFFSKIVYYLLMLLVLVGVFNTLDLEALTQPLNALLEKVFVYAPNIFAALFLILVAWIVAKVVKLLINKALNAVNFDDKLASKAGLNEQEKMPLSETIATTAYWLVFLFFLPAIISTLQISGLLDPVVSMVNDVMEFIPKLFAALITLFLGWIVARIIRQIVSNILMAMGVNKLAEKAGMQAKDGADLASMIGTIAYAAVLIPVVISALETLQLEAISAPATEMLSLLLNAIPPILGAAAVLFITYFVAKLVSGLVTSVLTGVGFNKIPRLLGLKDQVVEAEKAAQKEGVGAKSPSEIVGYVVLVVLMLFAAAEAANLLEFNTLAIMLGEFLELTGQIILGVIILGFGLFVGNFARDVIANSGSKPLGQVARIAIIFLAAAMGLRQMGIADDIVNLAFGLLLGGIAIAFALSFGLGGKDIAHRELEAFIGQFREEQPKQGK